jgi:hypothetical protein
MVPTERSEIQKNPLRAIPTVHSDGDAEHGATDIIGASEPDRKFKYLMWNLGWNN